MTWLYDLVWSAVRRLMEAVVQLIDSASALLTPAPRTTVDTVSWLRGLSPYMYDETAGSVRVGADRNTQSRPGTSRATTSSRDRFAQTWPMTPGTMPPSAGGATPLRALDPPEEA